MAQISNFEMKNFKLKAVVGISNRGLEGPAYHGACHSCTSHGMVGIIYYYASFKMPSMQLLCRCGLWGLLTISFLPYLGMSQALLESVRLPCSQSPTKEWYNVVLVEKLLQILFSACQYGKKTYTLPFMVVIKFPDSFIPWDCWHCGHFVSFCKAQIKVSKQLQCSAWWKQSPPFRPCRRGSTHFNMAHLADLFFPPPLFANNVCFQTSV